MWYQLDKCLPLDPLQVRQNGCGKAREHVDENAARLVNTGTCILSLTMKRTGDSVAQKHMFCGAGKLASSQHGREGVDSSVCSPCGPSWDSHKPSCGCDKVIVGKYFEPQLMNNSSQTISSTMYETEHENGRLFWP